MVRMLLFAWVCADGGVLPRMQHNAVHTRGWEGAPDGGVLFQEEARELRANSSTTS